MNYAKFHIISNPSPGVILEMSCYLVAEFVGVMSNGIIRLVIFWFLGSLIKKIGLRVVMVLLIYRVI
ncbi:MAG: hypothetical protein ACUVUR_00725 [bacterium]